jgi:hypothetical protein
MTAEPPPGVDLTVPSAARMYDYFLGGKDNFEVDRERAEQVIAALPQVRDVARANRAFLGAAVRTAARAGVTQFVDLGAGLPTQGHVHEVAHPIQPGARIVYVDMDPIACTHAKALLPDDTTTVICADIRRPHSVLDHPEFTAQIDWRRPVALLLVSVLHFISPEDDPAGVLAAFTRHMTSGSHLVLSVASPAEVEDDVSVTPFESAYEGSGTGNSGLLSPEQITDFFTGFPLIEPGLVDVHDWPTPARYHWQPGQIRLLAGVGRKP